MTRRRRATGTQRRDANSSSPSFVDAPGLEWERRFEGSGAAFHVSWSANGKFLAASGHSQDDENLKLWSAPGWHQIKLEGHRKSISVMGLSWHPKLSILATGDDDGKVRIWNSDTGGSYLFCSIQNEIRSVEWSPDGERIAIGDEYGKVGIWEAREMTLIAHATVHEESVYRLRWSHDGKALITCSSDGTIGISNADELQPIHRFHGHDGSVSDIALSPDGHFIASSSQDSTIRLWNVARLREETVLERHTSWALAVQFSPDGDFLASASASDSDPVSGISDGVRLWRCRDWEPVAYVPRQHFSGIGGLAFHPSQPLFAAKDHESNQIDCYKLDYALLGRIGGIAGSRRYGNAKVVLIGDTGVGKSGLSLVLSGQPYKPTDSTHGRNVWTLGSEEVTLRGGVKQSREVLLWDLAGQPGYRIIHQLHLNEVAIALIVFDSRSETDPFSGVKYWTRALAQARKLEGASAVPIRVYLVAARSDRGGVGVSAERIRAVVDDLGIDRFFETSAKEGWQVAELTGAIRDGIDWDALPVISSSVLFDSIKQFLIEEKQQGRLLGTADDLFRGYVRTHPDESDDDTLRASFETCVGRVESRGLIRRLHFGGLVLLQPELLDAYASGMVQAAKAEPDGLGFIAEEDALAGRFGLADSERVADKAQERLLLIATVEELLRHDIALKEATDIGVDLVFPSQFTRERPDAPDIPGKEVTFAFEGPLHNIYATLAVRLSHSTLFERQAMWQNAASYTATVGGMCGIHLRELEEGRGELVLFYDEQASRAVRSQFETYVADHLRLRAIPGSLLRRAIRACPNCGYVLPEDLVRRRLDRGAAVVRCPDCEEAEIALTEEQPTPTDTAVAAMNRSADERRDEGAAALRLKGKIETNDYDVFLCYSSSDRKHVVAIGEQLKKRGILPWLDIWSIPPGARWQKELQKQLKSIKSAAVFVGPKGAGPWQELEVESLLGQIAKRKRPLIPVILEGRAGKPRLPAFLASWHVVDMRQPDPDPFEQLVWGITGENQARS